MRSVKALRTAKIGYIIISAILCALGILLIAKPDISLSLIGVIVGIVLIVFGVIKLIGYFSKDLYQLAFQFDLAFGILLIALSIAILIHPENMMNFLCIVLGISILADGLFKIQTALDARRFGLKEWWLILSLAVIAGVIGAVLIFRPAESARILTILLGISMLSEGILNLCVVLCAVRVRRQRQANVIEIDFE
ncbi:MAG: HdeD family acid-resistance protein [Candidatus Ventricola sp.]